MVPSVLPASAFPVCMVPSVLPAAAFQPAVGQALFPVPEEPIRLLPFLPWRLKRLLSSPLQSLRMCRRNLPGSPTDRMLPPALPVLLLVFPVPALD